MTVEQNASGPAVALNGKTGGVQRVLVLSILAVALAVTAYGFTTLDWAQVRPWSTPELTAVAVALAGPVALLAVGSFTIVWPRILAAIVLIAALVTYGPAVVATLAFVGAGFMATGALVFRLKLETIEDGLLALALGFGLVGLVVGLTAPLRIHFDFTYAAGFLVSIVVMRRSLLDWFRMILQRLMIVQAEVMRTRAPNNLGVSLAAVLGVALMLYATAPESGFDALTTHFLFTETLREHGAVPLSTDFSATVFMPKTTVWALAVVDVIGGEFALRAAHASLLIVASALIGMRAARWMGYGPAGVLVASLLSAPVSLWISSQFFEETGSLMLISAACVFFLRGADRNSPALNDVLALAALGMAVSSKVQALFLGVIGAAVVIRRLAASPSLRSLSVVSVGSLIFLVVGGAFYIRALLLTGNPFYPFVPGQVIDARWDRPLQLTTPIGMTFEGNFMEAYPGGFAFQFLLLLGAGVAALVLLRLRSVSILALAALVFAVVLASQTIYARYQLYAFPLLMLSLAALYPVVTFAGRVALTASLVALTILNVWFWQSVHVPAFALNHLVAPHEAIEVPPERQAFAVINALAGDKAVVYVAGSSTYAAGLSGRAHSTSEIGLRIRHAPTLAEVADAVRDGGITHIVAVGPVLNPKVLEACVFICREMPASGLRATIFEVDLSRASLLADRTDAQTLLAPTQAGAPSPPPVQAAPVFTPGAGWAQESWGWWSTAGRTDVELTSGFVGASQIDARVQAFAPPGTDGLDVTILLDGVPQDQWRFEPGPIGLVETRSITLSSPIATDSAVLSFQFSRTYRPSETMGGGDTRDLAMGLLALGR